MQRLVLRRRLSYYKNSNRRKKVKIPGDKLVYNYQKKRGSYPKCGDCKCVLAGISGSRPFERKIMTHHLKTVSRAYGGVRCHSCVRQKIIRSLLMEEQQIIKQFAKDKECELAKSKK